MKTFPTPSKQRFIAVWLAVLCLKGLTMHIHGQTWETVDDYQLSASYSHRGSAITVDASGTVFAVGNSFNPLSGVPNYGVVRRSQDQGVTWQTVDQSAGWDAVTTVAASPAGVVVVAGSAAGTAQDPYFYTWRVRLSPDRGVHWSTVGELAAEYGKAAAACFDSNGAIYVAGLGDSRTLVRRSTDLGVTWSNVVDIAINFENLYAMKLTPQGMVLAGQYGSYWRVIQSTNQLASWSLQDDWIPPGADITSARGIAQDQFGNLIIVGGTRYYQPQAQPPDWVVRRSTDGGVTWTIADQLQFPLGWNGIQYAKGPLAVVTDVAGRIWATGSDDVAMLTRMSSDGGVTWSDSDSFTYDSSLANISAIGYGIAADSAGNVYAIGMGNMALPAHPHWIVRKLAAGLPPPPPSLSAALSGDEFSLSWPASFTGFILQSATTLTNGGDWQDHLAPPTEINGQQVVTITPTGSRGFFRLRGQ